GSGMSTMTMTVGSSTPTGTYPITVTGNGGGVQQNATVTLTVAASVPCGPSCAQVNLPTGAGWHEIGPANQCGSGSCASTTLIGSVADPGNPSNAMYTDDTQTATQSYDFSGNLGGSGWYWAWGGGWANDTTKKLCLFG